jgi:hypothetical protein
MDLGVKYGTKCKSTESHRIGVFVNVTRGQIAFSINGVFHKIAFSCDSLKKGPFYPAVALREGGVASFGKVIKNPDEIINL